MNRDPSKLSRDTGHGTHPASRLPSSSSSSSLVSQSDLVPSEPSKNRIFPILLPAPARSSSSLGHMGQSQSGSLNHAQIPPQPVPLAPSASSTSIASSTGGKLKRAFVGRRKKSEDVSSVFAHAQPSTSAPKERAAPALSQSPPQNTKPLFNVFTGRKHSASVSAAEEQARQPQQLNIPFKMTESLSNKKLPTPPELSPEAMDSHSLARGPLAVSPSTAAAIQLLAEPAHDKETPRRPNTAKEKPDHETKQDWRKSDSTTVSHVTIRPGAFGNRSPRPVSLAESSHSGHTIVPGVGMNKRLSALITDAEFAMAEENDTPTDNGHEGFVTPRGSVAIAPNSAGVRPSSSSSIKARNRRSMSLNIVPGGFSPKPKASTTDANAFTPTRDSFASTSSAVARNPPLARETLSTLSRTAAQGIIAGTNPPSGSGSLGSNLRGRLTAWTTGASSKRTGSAARAPSSPAATRFPQDSASNPNSHRQQPSVSISGHLTPAAIAVGIGKRAASKVHRVWGGLSSSSSSTSGHSSSSSTGTTPSSYHSADLGRSASDQSMPSSPNPSSYSSVLSAGVGAWKSKRRTPNAPSGSWSVTSSLTSSSSVSDIDGYGYGVSNGATGPMLGSRLRGPRRNAMGAPIVGGLVFGRELEMCVRDTAIDGVFEDKSENVGNAVVKPLEKRKLPALVVRCAQHILVWGVQEEGLFRVSGRPAHVAKLRSEFDTGADYNLVECDPGDLDPHAVASIFKAYLRELPQSLLTTNLIPKFEAVLAQEVGDGASTAGKPGMRMGGHGPGLPTGPRPSGNSGSNALPLRKPPSLSTLAMPSFAGLKPLSEPTIIALARLVVQLPEHNRDLLYTVVELIRATAARAKETKMTLGNLLLVFCPSLNMSPSLLRVFCEVEKVWDGAVLASASTVDHKDKESTTPKAGETFQGTQEKSADSETETSSAHADSNASSSSDLPNAASLRPRLGAGGREPQSTIYVSALDLPTNRVSDTSEGNDGASYVSALDGGSESSSMANSPHVPPLSSSTDSLATPSTMSEDPCFSQSSSAAVSREPSAEDNAKYDREGATGSPQIAAGAEEMLPPPVARPRPSETVPFPSSTSGSGSAPNTPTKRKSYALLSFPPLRPSEPGGSTATSPTSSTWSRRSSRPSLRLLFTKKSASPIVPTPDSISNPTPLSANIGGTGHVHSAPASAVSAVDIPARADTPPVLSTNISSSPLHLGFDETAAGKLTAAAVEVQSSSTGDSPDSSPGDSSTKASLASSSFYSTPQQTPIADHYRSRSTSIVGLPITVTGDTDDLAQPPVSLSASQPTTFPKSPSQCSLTPSINITLEDSIDDDWAQSVIMAAGSSLSNRRHSIRPTAAN
ncbi:RhoGAP-domain-containing protein, partial [Panus rudis PR-1116 ss-1]